MARPAGAPTGAPVGAPLQGGPKPAAPGAPKPQGQATAPVNAQAPVDLKALDGNLSQPELQDTKARFSNLNWDDELEALKDDHDKPTPAIQSGAWPLGTPTVEKEEPQSAPTPAAPPLSQSQQMQGMPGMAPGQQGYMPGQIPGQMPGQMPYYPGYQYPPMPGFPQPGMQYPPGFDQNASAPPGAFPPGAIPPQGMPPNMMYPPGYPQVPYDPNMQWQHQQGQMPPYGVQSGSGYPQVPYPNMPDPQAMAQSMQQAQAPSPSPSAPASSAPANPLDVDDDPFTQHVSDFESAPASPGSLPMSPLDKDDDPFASVVSKSKDEEVDDKAREKAEDSIGALLEAKLKEDDPFKNVEKIESPKPVVEEKSAEDLLDALLDSRLKEEKPLSFPPPTFEKKEEVKEEESDLGALLASKLKESSATAPKSEPPTSSSVLGQLLGALQDDEEETPKKDEEPKSLGSALSDAVDDMFSEAALKGNPDVKQVGLSEIKSLGSLNSSQEANTELADAVDKWLDNVESGAAKKESGFGAVAAKLSEVMGADEEEKPVDEPKVFDGESPKEKKGSHTSDALSRLLAAASMASDVPAVGGTKSFESVSAVGEPGSSINNLPPSTPFGPEPYQQAQASASSGADKFGQDAINAKIAEINRKLEQQGQTMGQVNIDYAGVGSATGTNEPQAVQDSRNVVNRIMEEAYAKQQAAGISQQVPAYQEASSNTAGGFSREELEMINSNKLAHMAQVEAARNKGNLRSRQSSLSINPTYIISGVLVVVIGIVGYFGFTQNWFGSLFSSSNQTKELTVSERDAKVSQEVDEYMKSGQIAKAITTLQDYNDKYEGLTPELESKLDKAFIALAKHHASTGDNAQAAEVLKSVPSTSKHYAEAQKLIKKYKGGKGKKRSRR